MIERWFPTHSSEFQRRQVSPGDSKALNSRLRSSDAPSALKYIVAAARSDFVLVGIAPHRHFDAQLHRSCRDNLKCWLCGKFAVAIGRCRCYWARWIFSVLARAASSFDRTPTLDGFFPSLCILLAEVNIASTLHFFLAAFAILTGFSTCFWNSALWSHRNCYKILSKFFVHGHFHFLCFARDDFDPASELQHGLGCGNLMKVNGYFVEFLMWMAWVVEWTSHFCLSCRSRWWREWILGGLKRTNTGGNVRKKQQISNVLKTKFSAFGFSGI